MKNVRIRIRVIAQVCIGEGVDEISTPAAAIRETEDITLTRVFSSMPRSSVAFAAAEHARLMLSSITDILPDRVQHSTEKIA